MTMPWVPRELPPPMPSEIDRLDAEERRQNQVVSDVYDAWEAAPGSCKLDGELYGAIADGYSIMAAMASAYNRPLQARRWARLAKKNLAISRRLFSGRGGR
jgi:hypothetical protein